MIKFQAIKINIKSLVYSIIYSTLYVIFLIMGDNLTKYQTAFVEFNIIPFLLIYILLILSCYLMFDNIGKIKLNRIKLPTFEKNFFQDNTKSFWNTFFFITICHIPAFLAYFPGIFTYDTRFQLMLFLQNNNIEMHPILHSLMIYAVWLIEKSFKTGWVGLLIYTLIQSTIVIAIYSYCIKVLSKLKISCILNLVVLLSFALYPTNQVFHLIATKDVLFCAFVLLFITLMAELALDCEKFLLARSKKLFLSIAILFMFLFRHNAIHAYLLCLPFILFYFRRHLKKLLIVFLFPLLFMVLFSNIKEKIGLEPPSSASALAVPLQQMARVRHFHYSELNGDEKNLYTYLVSKEKENIYEHWNVDKLKLDDFETQRSDSIENAIKNNFSEITNLYINWGIKYYKDYIDAFLSNTYKYWYINADYSKIYYPHTYLYVRYAPDVNIVDFFGVNIGAESKWKALQEIYDELLFYNGFSDSIFKKIFFAFAHNTWILFLLFFILHYEKKYNILIAFMIIPTLFITALLGPTAIIRYIWQNYQVLPVLLAFCLSRFEHKKIMNNDD